MRMLLLSLSSSATGCGAAAGSSKRVRSGKTDTLFSILFWLILFFFLIVRRKISVESQCSSIGMSQVFLTDTTSASGNAVSDS